MSIQSVINGIGTFLGGPYDPATRTYRSSPVHGVGVVRRAFAKADDHADYYRGMPPGTRTGCQIVITIPDQSEYRETVGPEGVGLMRVLYTVELNVFIRSECEYAEDAQDDVYALRDALLARLRSDHTLGGCVFQAGEAVAGGSAAISVRYGQPSSKAQLTKQYMQIKFTAVELTAV
ncbi:hypothetical protein [Streptomyces sp. NRRL S-350]|uniref:hypothetical protein n=1 Tax=Streptomyces sp. NRRL S-350 TaxID=1463902 RepID=UPI0004BFF23C|nr:hypothetical protein [Streptomyces sp. NRRL S-350]